MRWPRFTIRWILMAVAAVAVVIAPCFPRGSIEHHPGSCVVIVHIDPVPVVIHICGVAYLVTLWTRALMRKKAGQPPATSEPPDLSAFKRSGRTGP